MTESITLNELTQFIRSAIYGNFPDTVWVVAEISELHPNKSGHCYLELVEKDFTGSRINARMKAMVWANVYRNIKHYFEKTTGYTLAAGIKVLVLAQVEFHEVYGLSLNIRDIDPSFTLGDIARKKQETINRLIEDGVFDMNKTLSIPLVIQRIAIISSETAAGYGDFMDSLNHNPYGIRFITRLFPAVMQGEKSEASVISAFDNIYKKEFDFDVVALIRGGGAQSELDCFNSYDIAFYITQFPLPVITGIGHERDEAVADLVANTMLKTPTAVADFIINKTGSFLEKLKEFSEQIFIKTGGTINNFRHELRYNAIELSMSVRGLLNTGYSAMDGLQNSLSGSTTYFSVLKSQELTRISKILNINILHRFKDDHSAFNKLNIETRKAVLNYLKLKDLELSNFLKYFEFLDPVRIMKRGFSITRKNGKIIKDTNDIKIGDIIETILYKGSLSSRVGEIGKTEDLL